MSAPLLDEQYNKLESRLSALNLIVSTNLSQEISIHSEILVEIHSNLDAIFRMKSPLVEGIKNKDRIVKFHTDNLEVLKKKFGSISSDTYLSKIINEFTIEISQYLENAPEILKIEYPLDSFKAPKEDLFMVKVSYRFELACIRLQRISHLFANFFRRLFKKKEKSPEYRILKVHFRKLIQGYLLPEYISKISDILKESQKQLIESYTALSDFEYAFMQNDYSPAQEMPPAFDMKSFNLSDSIPSGFFGEHKNEFEAFLQRSGMLLSLNLLRNIGRKMDFNKSRENLVRINKTWQSTFFAFFEDWRFREQLFAYIQSVQSAHLSGNSIYTERIKTSLLPEAEKQLRHTTEMLERLPDPDTSEMESIRSFFVTELYRLKKEKLTEEEKKSILQATEDIPKFLQKLENEVSEELEIFAEKVGIVGHPKYSSGVRSSEIYYFSPGDFIEFECLTKFRSGLALLKSELAQKLHLIVDEFYEYDQIIDFYLDSTISLTKKPGAKEKEVVSFFRDGLMRLLNINNKVSGFLKSLQNEKLSEISALVKGYLADVAELDDNDNIINIYARLIKSKAIAESKSKREKLVSFAKKTGSSFSVANNKLSNWLKSSYSALRKRLKLDSAYHPISSEISNYLTDIQQRIFKLPLIYQHLFENLPLREFNLFLSRNEEIAKLNGALDDWLKDNFAATLVTGENGSGKSSLLYYYSKTLKSIHQILSFQVSRFYNSESDYYVLIGEIFKNTNLQSDETISAFISSLKDRRIIIIDGLERLFIRKVNGFTCLQKLLSLIVSTNHQIFWICSVSKYASVFLNKTIALSEYFDYTINIDSLNSKQIQDIVLKRNRLSGYQITYQMENGTEGKTRTKNLTQSELEEKFFDELNQFTGSNISLSLNYWLQAIHSIKEDHVEIGNFVTPDYGFLETISPEKAYTLLLIIMHGKISVEQHAFIFSQKMERSFKVLNILKEDSILTKQGEYFILNSILFRHVVRVLENRNLIN